MSFVFGDQGTSTYVSLLDSLDVTSVDFAQAREFSGVAGAATMGGKLFVSDGDSPVVTRFEVGNRGSWKEEGRVSFSNYAPRAPLFSNAMAGPTRAYMAYNTVDRAVWDPSTMQIVSQQPHDAQLPLVRDGLKVDSASSRGIVTRDQRVFWPVFWPNDDYTSFSKTTQIAVYDAQTDATRALLETPCPGLDFATQDEAGNIYFSNWIFSAVAPHYHADAPKNCAVRIKKGEERIDPDFSLRFSDLTGGREAAAFSYIGKGKGFMTVFHHERVPAGMSQKDAAESNNWRFWRVDLTNRTAAPVDEIDYFGGGYGTFKLDGRTFVLLVSKGYASTTTYEVLPDATIVKRFESRGWGHEILKIK
ncbi:MxcI [Pendulispora albinea]|uniref:MxcI n=1 Tax=Pendulispora albinea TaxID=2741071 RepID=A0ABZ2M7F1_9BACT